MGGSFNLSLRGDAPRSLWSLPPWVRHLAAQIEHSFTLEGSRLAVLGVPLGTPVQQAPAREKLVHSRAAPSCGAPTPQAAALPRCLVGFRFSRGRAAAVPTSYYFLGGSPPLRSPAKGRVSEDSLCSRCAASVVCGLPLLLLSRTTVFPRQTFTRRATPRRYSNAQRKLKKLMI